MDASRALEIQNFDLEQCGLGNVCAFGKPLPMAAKDISGRSFRPAVRTPGVVLVAFFSAYIARVAGIGLAVGIAIVALGVGLGYSNGEVVGVTAVFGLFVAAVVALGSREVAQGRAAASREQEAALAALEIIRTATDDTREAVVHCAHELEQHHAHTQGELARLRGLIDDAIVKLGAGFGALHELSLRQRGFFGPALAAASVRSDGDNAARLLIHLDATAVEFDHHVRAVVTALQFQDLASQLIDSAQARIEEARRFTSAVANAAGVLEHAAGGRHSIDRTYAASSLAAPGQYLVPSRRPCRESPVQATEIAAGAVDLFDGVATTTPECKS